MSCSGELSKSVHDEITAIPHQHPTIPEATLVVFGETNHTLHHALVHGRMLAIQPSGRQSTTMHFCHALCWHNSPGAASESVPDLGQIGVTFHGVVAEVVYCSVVLVKCFVTETPIIIF